MLNQNLHTMKTPQVDKFFTIDDRTQIKCYWIKTRYGFKHEAKMVRDGIECGFAKVCYYNRTWESFEYETVISNLLHKSPLYTDKQKRIIMDAFSRGEHEAIERQFAMIGAIAKMGEILCDGQKAQNDWKERMIKAGIGDGLIMPDDWGTLSEDERQLRLDGIIQHMRKAV
jgi:hypothetical protein